MKASAESLGPPSVGSRYTAVGISFGSSWQGRLRSKLNFKPVESVVTITAMEAPKRLAFDAENSNSVFHHEFTFSPAGGGTRVERHVTMTRGPFYFPIVLSIGKSTVRENYDGAMSNLKAKMESGG
jgi:hypothetical protein